MDFIAILIYGCKYVCLYGFYAILVYMEKTEFEWDDQKDRLNQDKHGLSFYEAQQAFLDPDRVIAKDVEHSFGEERYYCFGRVDEMVMTVRFTYRENKIRIIGAGYWRKGRKTYEEAQCKIDVY